MRASRSPLRKKSQSPPRKSGSPPRNRCVYIYICVSCMIARKRKYIPCVPSAFSCLLLSFTRSRSLSLLLFFSLPPSPTQLLALSCPLIFSLSRCLRLSLACSLSPSLACSLAPSLALSRPLSLAHSRPLSLTCSLLLTRYSSSFNYASSHFEQDSSWQRSSPPLPLTRSRPLSLTLSLSLSLLLSLSLILHLTLHRSPPRKRSASPARNR